MSFVGLNQINRIFFFAEIASEGHTNQILTGKDLRLLLLNDLK